MPRASRHRTEHARDKDADAVSKEDLKELRFASAPCELQTRPSGDVPVPEARPADGGQGA